MVKHKSSAELLESLWLSYQKQVFERHFGTHISKRKFSEQVLADIMPANTNTLAQWTNPGNKENWRIPIVRISSTVKALGGDGNDVNQIMLARLREARQANPQDTSVVVSDWMRSYAKFDLSDDERWLLNAYNKRLENLNIQLFSGAHMSEANKKCIEEALDACLNKELDQIFAENQIEDNLEKLGLTPSGAELRRKTDLIKERLSDSFRASRQKEQNEIVKLRQEGESIRKKRGITKAKAEHELAKQLKADLRNGGKTREMHLEQETIAREK